MNEVPKRLQPTPDTLRELFLKSGNMCAFPNCSALMMNAAGAFIGQVCHIEAAACGGARFNSAMTNDERRAASNLVLLCYEHHKVTDDVSEHPLEKMRQYKRDHEGRFARPDRAILSTLRDWTAVSEPKPAKNLVRLNKVLGWELADAELSVSAVELADYVQTLQSVPVGVRAFLGKVAARAHRMRKKAVVADFGRHFAIACHDLEGAFQKNAAFIDGKAAELHTYDLGYLDVISISDRELPALKILSTKESGWKIWLDLAAFCERANVPIETLSEDLDFSVLDE